MRDDRSRSFLEGGGRMGALIRAHDWASTPLGPPEDWPQSLRSALSICLNSSFPTAIYWGRDLRLLYNDAWAPIPAERHPWALGRPGREVWADIWDVVGPQMERVLATGEGFSTYDQLLAMLRDGTPRETYWNYSFTPIRGESGEVAGVLNQGNETTAIVLARRRAEADVARLAHLFQQAPGAVALLRGPRHVFEIANPAYLELVGGRDILGRPARTALPEVIDQGFIDLLDQVYRTGEAHRGRAVPILLEGPDGPAQRYLDFVYQPVDDTAGKRYGIFVQATDVSDTMRAQAALLESEAKYEAIVNSIDQMIWSTRADGYHDYFNDRWYEFTGVPEGSTDGAEWNGVFHPDDRHRSRERWEYSLQTGAPYHIEYRLRHRSGQYRWVIGRAQCVRAPSGEIVRWFGTCTDIHDLKMAEESQQLVTRELHHRVKNLFSIVSGMVAITSRTTETAQEMGAALKGRLQALSTAHELIRVGSAAQSGPAAAPLQGLIEKIVQPYLQKDRSDQVSISGPAITVSDQATTSLALILHELATNAAKYGAFRDAEGTLAIRWDTRDDGFTLTWTETRPQAGVTAPSGSGFGNRLVQSIVSQLGGDITLDWEPTGLRIVLTAPLDRIGALG